MNVIEASPPTTPVWDCYVQLPPGPKLIPLIHRTVNPVDEPPPPGQGRIPKVDGPGVRNGAARLAKSHSSFRVSLGSITSSTQNASAVR